MAGFFESDKTPWEAPGEVLVWGTGMVVAAFMLHNAIRLWRRH